VEIKTELIDELLKDYQKPEDIIGENGLLKRFVKAVLERALNAELTHHLGYEKHDPAGNNSGNSRNGTSGKTWIRREKRYPSGFQGSESVDLGQDLMSRLLDEL
jgi:transposase-like protein